MEITPTPKLTPKGVQNEPKNDSKLTQKMSSEMTHRDMMIGSYGYDGSVTEV